MADPAHALPDDAPAVHPVMAAMRRAPVVHRMTAEQKAEADRALADLRAGQARLVPQEGVPAALEEMYRAERGE